ncbi:hypothetical protein NQ318_006444 [Aromia moschata]|uniref:Uncharacterized protein n=1 Tax=Aromia moschata TaxID=1265417 RepID=A0AAV8XPQ4_9CUCU|nr:hypothetical protein NQ318_006444 [Aromia moschata]
MAFPHSASVSLLCLVTLASSKPIMVSFGTNEGPIVPRQPKAATVQQRTVVPSPAPVSEIREDVPNPNQYKPLIPRQYRTKIFSLKPPANLLLGTPLDQKYTPALQKKDYSKGLNLGVDYTGPHIFEKQDYETEIYNAKKELHRALKYHKPQYYQQVQKTTEQTVDANSTAATKYVPQIGVIYLAGVRYYIPQVAYLTPQKNSQNPEEENSVYDNHDVKYSH